MFLPKLIPLAALLFISGTCARFILPRCSADFDRDGLDSLGQGPCSLPNKRLSDDIVMNMKRNPQGTTNPGTTPAGTTPPAMGSPTTPAGGGSTEPGGSSGTFTTIPATTVMGSLGRTSTPGNQGAPTPMGDPAASIPTGNEGAPTNNPANNNPIGSTPANNQGTTNSPNNSPGGTTPTNSPRTTSPQPSTAVIITTTNSQGSTITTVSFQGGATTRLPLPTSTSGARGRVVGAGVLGSVASFATFVVMVFL